MQEVLNTIATSIGLGVTTSVVWAALVLAYNWRRNYVVEKSIRDSIQPTGTTISFDGTVGMEIENTTLIPVTVRAVELIGGEYGKGTITVGVSDLLSPRGTTADERGWVQLPPRTKATWSLPFQPKFAERFDDFRPIKEIRVTVEYMSLFGTTRIIEVGPAKYLRPSEFEGYLDGNLYEAMEKRRAEFDAERQHDGGIFG